MASSPRLATAASVVVRALATMMPLIVSTILDRAAQHDVGGSKDVDASTTVAPLLRRSDHCLPGAILAFSKPNSGLLSGLFGLLGHQEVEDLVLVTLEALLGLDFHNPLLEVVR